MENTVANNVEELRDEVIKLLGKGIINQTKKYWATEKVMRKIMADYRE